jgi:hypothetical protein
LLLATNWRECDERNAPAKEFELPMSTAPVLNAEPPKEGVVVATVFDIDPQWIVNYRTEISDEDLEQLRGSIDEASKKPMIGIKQTILGTWNKGISSIYLVAGFCRYLCAYLIALRPLIKEWNEHFGYKAGDEGFLPYNGTDTAKENRNPRRSPIDRWLAIRKIREQGGEWAEKFDTALKSWRLQVNLRDYGDVDTQAAKALAMIDNVDENENRTDPSLADKLARIEMLIESGAKAKQVADVMGLTEGQVSAFRKISAVPSLLRERFQSAEMEAAYPNVVDRQKEQTILETAVNEYARRLKEPEDSAERIPVQHAKNFAFAINNAKKPINVKELGRLTRFLVSLSDDGRPTTKSTPDLTVFNSRIDLAVKNTKLPEETAAVAPAADGTVAAPTATVELTVEDLAIRQAAERAAVGAAADIAAQQNKAETVSGDAAKEAELKAANATAPVVAPAATSPSLAPLTTVPPVGELGGKEVQQLESEVGFDDMLSGVEATPDLAAAAAAQKPADTSGQTRVKTTETVTSPYKRVADEKVEASANAYLKDSAVEETATIIDQAGYIAAAMEDFFMLGMQGPYQACNKLHVTFTESANSYLKELEAFVEAKGTAEEKELIKSAKPKYEVPSLA